MPAYDKNSVDYFWYNRLKTKPTKPKAQRNEEKIDDCRPGKDYIDISKWCLGKDNPNGKDLTPVEFTGDD